MPDLLEVSLNYLEGNMANKKITYVKTKIMEFIMDYGNFLPGYIDSVFSHRLKMEDVVEMAVFELIKFTYDSTEIKHSVRYYYKKYGIIDHEDEEMLYRRILKYAQKYRLQEYNWRTNNADYYDDSDIDLLLSPDMSDMNKRIEGYNLTEMNFFELTNMIENVFFKLIVERRLIDSKKVSNAKFKEIMSQYDEMIKCLKERSEKSVDEMVFSVIAAFTIEWKYNTMYIYNLAKNMDDQGISKFADMKNRIGCFCGDIYFYPSEAATVNRMITVRDRYTDLVLNEPQGSEFFKEEVCAFLEGVDIVAKLFK